MRIHILFNEVCSLVRDLLKYTLQLSGYVDTILKGFRFNATRLMADLGRGFNLFMFAASRVPTRSDDVCY